MGGVCATTCCGTCGAFAEDDVCDAAVREVRARTKEESKATMRMVAFLETISGQIVCRKYGNQQTPACSRDVHKSQGPLAKTEGLWDWQEISPTP
jgi:hypothetical protein